MTQEQLDNIFTYHKTTAEQAVKYEQLRPAGKVLAELVNKLCPESREKSLALTKIQEAVQMANASIAIHE